MIYKNKRKVKT